MSHFVIVEYVLVLVVISGAFARALEMFAIDLLSIRKTIRKVWPITN